MATKFPTVTGANPSRHARVSLTGGGEYRVKFYRDHTYYEPGDYFTNDKDDALGTARSWCNEAEPVEVVQEDYSI